MTLVQLQHFLCLARTRSFVKAAEQLFITQPALSRSIKALEDELGQLLFDRAGRKIELTRFGQEVLQRSQQLVDDANELRQSGQPHAAGSTGRIRLGLSSGPGLMLTAPLLTLCARQHPQLHVEVSRANTETLVRQLRERQVDALIVDVRSLQPASDLQVEQLMEMDAGFMCRRGHPLTELKKVSFSQLAAYPIASTPLSDEVARILVERYGRQAHPHAMVTLSSDELSHLIEVAEHSDAVVLGIRAAGPHLVQLNLSPPLRTSARFGLVTVARRAQPPFLQTLRQLMAQTLV
jgi:DNA-binding transcriptional LysR family regulator